MNKDQTPAKILVIDDESAIRRSFADHLEDRGLLVLTAENGRIGLELLAREKPQVVLLDLRMPEVDGMEVLRSAREISPETALIVVSGTGRIADSIQALRLGAWDYILKPVEDMSIISHAVEKSLERVRLRSENRAYQEKLEVLVRERTGELEQANTRLTHINTRLRKVVETTRGLTACSEIGPFGSTLLRGFAEHMMASEGSLYFIEGDGLRLRNALGSGHTPDFIPFPLSVYSVFKHVIEGKEPLFIQDIAKEKNVSAGGWDGYTDGSLLAFPLPDETGRIVGILTLHNKIHLPFVEQDKEIGAILASYSCETLRAIQATEALRESKALLAKSQEIAHVGSWDLDLVSNRLTWTDEIYRIFGMPPQAFNPTYESFLDGIHPADRAAVDATYSASLREGEDHCEAEHRIIRRDTGEVRYVHDKCLHVKDATGAIVRSIGMMQDITARKLAEAEKARIEDQYIQAQKMEAIGTLAGGIAHDFNNILSAILGYSELCLSDLNPENPLRNKLEAIYKAGERARELVAQILSFSRSEKPERSPVRVDLILKDALKLLRPAIPSTIKIRQRIDTQCTILGDPTRMHQIIMNLCTNAYQAMSASGGMLGLSLIRVEMECHGAAAVHLPPGRYVKLAVSDTGCGISPENLARIFDPYFTTKEQGKGTGLGLAVVHGIVQSHGGAIGVKSKVDAGTEFEVYLPAVPDGSESREAPESRLPGGDECILLVDDEKDIVAIEKEMLEKLGYRVTATDRADEVVKIFSDSPEQFHMVISDMTMPGITGVRLAEKLREINSEIRIIICSGYNETISPASIHDLGIDGYLSKPVTMREIAKTVRNVLDEKRS